MPDGYARADARYEEAAEAPYPAEPPNHLPREETVLAPGERCADCGGRLKRLGEDVTEELEYIPGRFLVKRIVRLSRDDLDESEISSCLSRRIWLRPVRKDWRRTLNG